MKLKTVSLVVSAIISSSAFAASGYQYSDGLEIKLSDENKNASIIKRPNFSWPTLIIEKPDSNNISHNKFDKFNVSDNGLYINNRKGASVIINEVVSDSSSVLKSDIMITNGKADLIIANPNGITCNGCSTTNALHTTFIAAKITKDSVKDEPETYKSVDGKIEIINSSKVVTDKNNKLSLIANKISVINSNIIASEVNIDLLKTEKYKPHHTGEYIEETIITRGDSYTRTEEIIQKERTPSELFIDEKSSFDKIDVLNINSNFGIINNNGNLSSKRINLNSDYSTFNNNGKISSYKLDATLNSSTLHNAGLIYGGLFNLNAKELPYRGYLDPTYSYILYFEEKTYYNSLLALINNGNIDAGINMTLNNIDAKNNGVMKVINKSFLHGSARFNDSTKL
ncbi:filamentous hemagglutinin N-terminal domain-containing protein [Morganella morganii]|nr:filamentous hemagglutinin N-terminal domain-containing protein [Morganella morganii]